MFASRLLMTAAAAALFLTPVAALAQGAAAPAAVPAPAAATPAPAPAVVLPPSPHVVPGADTIVTLRASGHFTILLKAFDATGLTTFLKGQPQLTLFAPTDDAFNALPPAQLKALMDPKNAGTLQRLLAYHLINSAVDSTKIKGAKGPVATVEKTEVVLDGSTDVLKVNDADIIQADVKANNGALIQVLDKVLVPTDLTLPTG